MKDLEKIKSEDLAAQVQDANPGNFAIEQEVAQLVGATVPAPTEPSADDARELGAQLLVFLRRALLPIRSALRTAVAAIYAHLDSRCTDYTPAAYDPFRLPAGPYDPMRPLTPRTLPNLLTALTAFSDRKISNGSAPNDGIPDGISLARLLGESATDVTVLVDDNPPYDLTRNLAAAFPNLVSLTLNCKSSRGVIANNLSNLAHLYLPYLETIDETNNPYGWTAMIGGTACEELEFPKLKSIYTNYTSHFLGTNNSLKKVSYPELTSCYIYSYNVTSGPAGISPVLEECLMPKLTSYTSLKYNDQYDFTQSTLKRLVLGKLTSMDARMIGSGCTGLIDLEFGDGIACNINVSAWNPTDKGTTFLQNFKNHIALRLTSNGSGKTLTLSQAVFSSVFDYETGGTPEEEARNEIRDEIMDIFLGNGWEVQDSDGRRYPPTT